MSVLLVFVAVSCLLGLASGQDQQSLYDQVEAKSRSGVKLEPSATLEILKKLAEPPFGDEAVQDEIKYLLDLANTAESKCNMDFFVDARRRETDYEEEDKRNLALYVQQSTISQINLCIGSAEAVVKPSSEPHFTRKESDDLTALHRYSKNWGHPWAIAHLVAKSDLVDYNVFTSKTKMLRRFKEAFSATVEKLCTRAEAVISPNESSYRKIVDNKISDLLPKNILVKYKTLDDCREILAQKETLIQDAFIVFNRHKKRAGLW